MKIYKITDLLVTALESITAKEKQNGKIKKTERVEKMEVLFVLFVLFVIALAGMGHE